MNKFLKAVEQRIDRERDERMTVTRATELPEYDSAAYQAFYAEQRAKVRREDMLEKRSKKRREDWFKEAMDAARAKDKTRLREAQGHLTQRDNDKLSQWMAEQKLV